MATVYTERGKNIRRTWSLMTVFFVVIIAIGYFVSYHFNNPSVLYLAIGFSLLMNFFSYFYSDKVALKLSKAVPAKREECPDLFQITENLAITAGLPMPALYIIHDASPNAFATGRNPKHSAIAVTTGLLQLLDRTELEGVIAHEMSHIGNRDILLSTVVVVLVGFISIMADIFMRGGITNYNKHSDSRGNQVLMILGFILVILSPIFAQLIQLAVSRKREFLADASGVLLTRYPEGLANALRKIEAANVPLSHPHAATAHLFIHNTKKISALFRTHPPTEDRIKAILTPNE